MPTNTIVTMHYRQDRVFEAVNENGNAVSIDMRPAAEKQGQSPTELLLSALCACASVDLVQILKKRRRTVQDLTVVANGVRRDDQPRKFTEITLTFTVKSPDVEQAEFEKMGLLAATKYCSVAATLDTMMSHEFLIER